MSRVLDLRHSELLLDAIAVEEVAAEHHRVVRRVHRMYPAWHTKHTPNLWELSHQTHSSLMGPVTPNTLLTYGPSHTKHTPHLWALAHRTHSALEGPGAPNTFRF